MAKFQTDLQDVYFNLFEQFKVHKALSCTPDDIKDIVRELDKFVDKEVYPTRQPGDKDGVHLKNGHVNLPKYIIDSVQKYYENGWYGLGLPEAIGGMPTSEMVSLACKSIMTGANVAWSMYPGLSRAAMNVVLEIGTDKQKEVYIPKMMTGEWGGTMCLTEPSAGSDVGALLSTAAPRPDGLYNIKGVKIFISGGDNDIYKNIISLVLARTPGAPKGPKGLSLFLVSKYKLDASGNATTTLNDAPCTKVEEKMGIHASATCEMTFGANGDCVGEMIGKEFEGMANMFLMMNEARLMCGMQGESQANLAYELTLQYCKERVQFSTEIINHADVKRMLLRMRSVSRGMRTLNFYIAGLMDQVHAGDKSCENEIALLTPIAKAFCTDQGFNVSVDAIQCHGGYGFCSEYGIEQFARDTKIATIYEGTNGIQANDFVMRKILKDQGKTFLALGSKIEKTLKDPRAAQFKEEVEQIGKYLVKAQEIFKSFAGFAATNNFDEILKHAVAFLEYSSHIVVAWQMLEGAMIASDMKASDATNLHFYEGKIEDFRNFCLFYLAKNSMLAHQMLNWRQSLTSIHL